MDYTNRNWLLRVVQSGRDGKMFHEFWRELGALVADATWGASHQNNINVAALLQRLDPSKPCPYQVGGKGELGPQQAMPLPGGGGGGALTRHSFLSGACPYASTSL